MKKSAYETGIQTGLLNKLPLQQIQKITDVYTFQESYNDFGTLLLSGLLTMDFLEDEQSMQKIWRYLSISMTDVVIKEEFLLKEYEKVLREINE